MEKFEQIVQEVGQRILKSQEIEITDTHVYKGHESSTIDITAKNLMQAAIEMHVPDFEGIIRFELRPYSKTLIESHDHVPLVLIIDELDGTTNTKRYLSSAFQYHPLAAISIALALTSSLEDLVIGAVYTLDTGDTFSALRFDREQFLAFHNRQRILPQSITRTRGDSQSRIMVIGYSNSHRMEKGTLEDALWHQGFRTYEGCRASSMDVISILRNSFDAYIDLRSYWSTKIQGEETEAMLQVYDVAGVLPIAQGCGLKVTDAQGKPWGKYSFDDSIPLVVARPDIHTRILNAIRPLVEEWQA